MAVLLFVPSLAGAGLPPCFADLNDDGRIGPADLAALLGAWGPNSGHPADYNGDGMVAPADLAALLGAWGLCNDDCADALEIADGDTDYDTIGATTDGPAHAADCDFDGQTYHDIWYHYTASCSGTLTVTTCNQADYDTDLVLYSGCGCATMDLMDCNDDDPVNPCGGAPTYHSTVVDTVAAGNCYTIRVGGFDSGDVGSGTLTITCEVGTACPGPGDCCAGNGTPGCMDAACCEEVCSFDDWCCDVEWDSICAEEAATVPLCGCSGGPSNCCYAHGGLGCDDPACEEFVCGLDPWCCDMQWDEFCANTANAVCDVCF